MIIREVFENEKDNYNQVVKSITQSWEWGEFREKTGKKVIRLGGFEGSKMVEAMSIFLHPIAYFSHNIGYIPRGFISDKKWLAAIYEIGKKHNCVFIKIDREIEEEKAGVGVFNLVAAKSVLPQYTFWLDLTKDENGIMAAMGEKTRYNIRLGTKHKVVVKEGKTEADVEIFIKFLGETERRQGFYSHYPEYYRLLWKTLGRNFCRILTGYINTIPLASIMLFKFKDILYYPYGGSSLEQREKMANYVVHWEAIKLGKKLGCTVYDMWGAYKEQPKPVDPWFGIWRFKKGFGGKLVSYPDSLDLVIDKRLYNYYLLADKIRWKLLGAKRKILSFIK